MTPRHPETSVPKEVRCRAWEVLEGPALRVDFEYTVWQLFVVQLMTPKQTRQGCVTRLWDPNKNTIFKSTLFHGPLICPRRGRERAGRGAGHGAHRAPSSPHARARQTQWHGYASFRAWEDAPANNESKTKSYRCKSNMSLDLYDDNLDTRVLRPMLARLSFQQPTFQTTTTHQCLFSCTFSYLVCFKWNYEMTTLWFISPNLLSTISVGPLRL